MIGLDTNIIVRYLTQDDPAQSRRASRLIETELTGDNQGFISVVTMAETAWVLQRSYGVSDSELAAAVELMLQADALSIESEQEVFSAMIALRDGLGSFSDALVVELASKAGCAHTLTFDKKALRISGFVAL
jgi:predicted nucleic-acid-binding protein